MDLDVPPHEVFVGFIPSPDPQGFILFLVIPDIRSARSWIL